ncbi:cobyrinic acid a,c-diamide synthase [Saccharobesus litoralis]|uniref:Cobyrinic acid a,c-diamide synthase n=1 Tax=Saccharobesus litoralis TaxID=2172099 RepID=A0A2S0VQA2_9ALTE|nr:AAA family ATPase [Saccharobesus litoralis]AWB66362.1 cobyrinic acid a,c-diamide synthase [Saccharobesus litoralis]
MKILACYSMKGGVGKTATSVNMAWFAAQAGVKTLLIDMDPQGASTFYFRAKQKKKAWDERFFQAYENLLKNVKSTEFENLDILAAHLSFRSFDINLSGMKKAQTRLQRVLKGFKKNYDLIILDCPPTISLLSENVFNAADMILVPVIPTTLSERTLEQLNSFFQEHELPVKNIVPYLSMVQRAKAMHKDSSTRLRDTQKRLLKAAIPFSSDVEKMGLHCLPLGEFASNKSAFIHYRSLWREVFDLLEGS